MLPKFAPQEISGVITEICLAPLQPYITQIATVSGEGKRTIYRLEPQGWTSQSISTLDSKPLQWDF